MIVMINGLLYVNMMLVVGVVQCLVIEQFYLNFIFVVLCYCVVFFYYCEWCGVDDGYLVSVCVKCLLCECFISVGDFLVSNDDFVWVLFV